MCRAAAQGFRLQCRPGNAGYRIREMLYLDELQDDADARMLGPLMLTAAIHTATYAITDQTSEANEHREQTSRLRSLFIQALAPWHDTTVSVPQKSVEELIKGWENVFGSLDSPEVQAEIKRIEELKPESYRPIEFGTPI